MFGRSRKRASAVVVVVGLLATLAGCSSDVTTSSLAPGPTGRTAPAVHNVADIDFARRMIPHHRQALTMAESALDPKAAANTSVRELANRIKTAQDPEIATMSQWLQDWNVSQPSTSTDMAGMGTMALPQSTGQAIPEQAMPGMMSDADMAELSDATGHTFDQTWLTMMIRHHQGAVAMAEVELRDGSYPDAVALARQIVTAQQSEIAEMQTMVSS